MFKNLYGVQLWGMMNTDDTCGYYDPLMVIFMFLGVRCLGVRKQLKDNSHSFFKLKIY